MPFPFGLTVTVVPQIEDPHGDWTADPDNPSYDVDDCACWPTTSKETVEGGMDIVVLGLTCWMPVGTPVKTTDKVEVNGITYRVNGEPGTYQSPFTNFASGIEVQLTTMTG